MCDSMVNNHITYLEITYNIHGHACTKSIGITCLTRNDGKPSGLTNTRLTQDLLITWTRPIFYWYKAYYRTP